MAHHPKKDFRLLIMVSVYKNRGTKLFRNIKDNRKQENLSRKSCLLRDEYNRKTAFQLFYTTKYELFSLTEDINYNIFCPIRILTIPGEPANTLEVVAQGDNCRFFAYFTVVFNHLPQPHSREQAITQTAPFFCIEL